MEKLRSYLQRQLGKKLSVHGIVVWDDPAREYANVQASVVPPDAESAAWDGSWFELRHRVERKLSGENPPSLVIYVPAQPPEEDPLAEIRESGGQFKLRVATLVRQALAGELNEARLREIGEQAETFEHAEAAISATAEADLKLVSVMGTPDTVQMAIALLLGQATSAVDEANLWPSVSVWLSKAFGASLDNVGEPLVRGLTRHLILVELDHRLGVLPGHLGAGWSPPSAEQRNRALAVLDAWRRDRHRIAGYSVGAAKAEQELGIADALQWDDSLAELDSVPGIEEMALQEAVRRLVSHDYAGAQRLAEARLRSSLWVRERLPAPLAGAEMWGPRWRTALALASLGSLLRSMSKLPRSVSELLAWYADSGWRVDQAHRNLELALSDLHTEGVLEEVIGPARGAYESWLEKVMTSFTSALEAGGLDVGQLLRQSEIHGEHVVKGDGPVAYVWADAFRYEVGAELAEALSESMPPRSVHLEAAVAAIPTITPVGMANLCPGAETSFALGLDGQRLTVEIGGTSIKGVPERVSLLRAAHGEVLNLTLQDVFDQGEKQLAKKIGSASVVLVRSQEMDAAGESGMLAVAWSNFELVKQQLVRAVARLGQAGVRRVVISADHGFVALSRGLQKDRVVDAPKGGTGELHRRGWVGHGGMTSPSTIRMALGDAGIKSDLDIIAPRGLAVFAAGGARRFFHGGLSPQELLVPVVVCETQRSAVPQKLNVRVSVAGDRVTTGAFSAWIEFDPDLLRSNLEVRVTVTRMSDGLSVAQILAGDRYDRVSGKLRVEGDEPTLLTFQVTQNLARGDQLQVQVFDVGTDRLIADRVIRAEAPVEVKDDLG